MQLKTQTLVAAGALLLGTIFHFVGLATPEWNTANGVDLGLWEVCVSSTCQTIENKPDWLEACGAMAILGLLAGAAGLGVWSCVAVMDSVLQKPVPKLYGLIVLATAGAALFFIFLCIIIFAAKADDDYESFEPGYSFVLSLLGGLLYIGGGATGFKAFKSNEIGQAE